ncbi:hypothetical protein M0Q97_13460 [Candidatus Dojkabacteria bacterium]|jgi:hypothetical protein|nr:hypothetical protein [Candidatus Dojkabacteria bacterium]
MKTKKSIKSFHAIDVDWNTFGLYCKMLSVSQTDVLNDLIKNWNTQQKDAVNNVFLKMKGVE